MEKVSSSLDDFNFAALDEELTIISGGYCRKTNDPVKNIVMQLEVWDGLIKN